VSACLSFLHLAKIIANIMGGRVKVARYTRVRVKERTEDMARSGRRGPERT
jgi:hypothetical protein